MKLNLVLILTVSVLSVGCQAENPNGHIITVDAIERTAHRLASSNSHEVIYDNDYLDELRIPQPNQSEQAVQALIDAMKVAPREQWIYFLLVADSLNLSPDIVLEVLMQSYFEELISKEYSFARNLLDFIEAENGTDLYVNSKRANEEYWQDEQKTLFILSRMFDLESIESLAFLLSQDHPDKRVEVMIHARNIDDLVWRYNRNIPIDTELETRAVESARALRDSDWIPSQIYVSRVIRRSKHLELLLQ